MDPKRLALVTGANKGIGRQIATDLAAAGCVGLVCARDPEKGAAAADRIAVTLAMTCDLQETGIKVNAACPGFTASDLNNFEGVQTVQQAARRPVALALPGVDGPRGPLSRSHGAIPC